MGIYKKIGLRAWGIEISHLINWIRLYGLKNGFKTWIGLLFSRKNHFVLNNNRLGPRFIMRNNVSDKAMFMQTFLENQYLTFLPLISNPKYIVDAGANIGIAARFFHMHYPDAHIISIEPDDTNVDYIKRNIEGLSNIDVVKGALWYRSGNMNISNPDGSPSSFMVQESSEDNGIPAYSIPDLMIKFNIPSIDILKIDIEGAEKELLEKDAVTWLPKVKCLIIELHDNYKKGTGKAFVNALQPFDFEMYSYSENICVIFNH